MSSGVRPVDWVYVDDVVDALIAASRRADLGGETLDVGSGRLVTVRALAEELAGIVGTDLRPVFGARPDRPNEVVRAADVERTKRVLGWEPRVSLVDGLRRTVEWYRADSCARDLFNEAS